LLVWIILTEKENHGEADVLAIDEQLLGALILRLIPLEDLYFLGARRMLILMRQLPTAEIQYVLLSILGLLVFPV
jgi:hypothetical protein